MRLVFLFCLVYTICSLYVCNGYLFGNNGVTALKLYTTARKYIGSAEWSKAGNKHGDDYRDKYKCNLFVYDILRETNAVAPHRHWLTYSPIGANEWGNPTSSIVLGTHCYVHVSSPSPGDIVAFPYNEGLGHVGIVTYNGEYTSAGDNVVEEKTIPGNRTKTYWRYQYNSDSC